MNYIILDLEWNQPDSHENSIPGIPFEIIEIGAVKLDSDFKELDSFHKVISPKHYKHMHHITGELTQISTSELKNGVDFVDAATEFINWCGDEYSFCTWGSMDIYELQRNMNYYHMPLLVYPVYFYDLQKVFSLTYDDGKIRRSLEYAVDFFDIPKNLSFHRAIEDAKYTSYVFSRLNMDILKNYYSIDVYQLPTSKKNEIYADYGTYTKYISRGFENKIDLMKDKTVIATPCTRCGTKLKKKIRWFSGNSKTYRCLCACPNHGLIKGKIRIKKHDNGLYYAIRTLKQTDSDGADAIKNKQLEIRKKRRLKRHSNDN